MIHILIADNMVAHRGYCTEDQAIRKGMVHLRQQVPSLPFISAVEHHFPEY